MCDPPAHTGAKAEIEKVLYKSSQMTSNFSYELRCLWYAGGLCLCSCVITPRGFTSLPPDLGELLVYHHHIFRKTGTASTHSKSGMAAYQGGVHSVGVGIVVILLCVTNITSNIYLNNAT